MQFDKDNFKALIDEEAVEGWNIVANDDPCIGTYKTKERALEVLDEIHQRLIDLQALEIVPDFHKATKRCLDNVYEMPKDEEE